MEAISAEVFSVDIWHGNYWSKENPVLAFARFRRGRIGALRKKLLKQFTAVLGVLDDIIV